MGLSIERLRERQEAAEWERERWRRRGDATAWDGSEQYVYFVQAASGPIKIGVSTKPLHRLASIQSCNHEEVQMIAMMKGTELDEATLQHRFAHLRIRGEWFKADDELLTFIGSLGGEKP